MSPRGTTLLFVTIVIGFVMLAVAVSATQIGLSTLRVADEQQSYEVARGHLQGCLDEVLIHTQKDGTYVETFVTTNQAVCGVLFIPGDPATIELSLTEGFLTLHRQVTVQLDPFTLLSVSGQ